MIGQTISHYKITEKLGEGGMGVVYKAEDTKLDRTVALKFLPESLTPTEEDRRRFIREAKAAAALNHPNICTIYSVDEYEDRQFISMEYIDGETLRAKMDAGDLTMEIALDYAAKVADALAKAHQNDIIHRDIKPDNIMVNADGHIKVMDFGLAKLKHTHDITKTGSTVGTLAYMSPEQIQGKQVDHRADLFSLGIVLYKMLTGSKPFRGEHQAAMTYAVVNEEPAPISRYLPEAPEELAQIFEKLLAKDPEDRLGNAGEVAELLENVKESANISSQQTSPAETESKAEEQEDGSGSTTFSITVPTFGFGKKSIGKMGLLASTIGILALILFTGWWFVGGSAADSNMAVLSDGSQSEITDRSIAVLPFDTIGENENSTFTAGIHGGLLTRLSNISGLKVTSRTSTLQYRENMKPINQISDELNVNWIVRGEVQENRDRVQVSARLIYATEDRQVWAQNYQRDLTANNLFEIQSDLALEIINELQTKLSPEELTRVERKPTQNLDAYRLYMEGVGLLEQRTPTAVIKSVDYFMDAIEIDPEYAPAWAILAEALIYIDFYKYDSLDNYSIKPRKAVDTALELNPNLAEAYGSLGILYYTQKMGTKAITELKRAIELQPSLESSQNWLGFVYLLTGQPEQAIYHARRAIELNPLAPASRLYPSLSYLANGQPEQALREVTRAREIQPDWGEVYAYEGVMLYHNGRYSEALASLRKAESLIGIEASSVWVPDIESMMTVVKLAMGDNAGKDNANALQQAPFWTGLEQTAKGNHEEALAAFQQIDQFSMWPNLSLRYFFPDLMDPVRGDARYQDILERMDRQWE